MANPNLQISRDASDALREWSEEFSDALALGDFEDWVASTGLVRSSDALKTTFPIPISAAGYHEFKGDDKYRSLYHRSLSMTTKEWSDGVEEIAAVIEAPDFIDWAGEPARMAFEWKRLPMVLVMSMLESSAGAGPLLDFYADKEAGVVSARRLFATDHPANVLDASYGAFDNTMTTTEADIRSGSFFGTLNNRFRSIKGPNGKRMGLRLAGGQFLVPSVRDQLFKEALELDTIVRAIDNAGKVGATANVVAGIVQQGNLWKGTKHIVTDESTRDDYFFAIAGGKPGLYPYVVQQGTPEEFVLDKSSEHYIKTGKIAISERGRANVAACLPHRIMRVQITG